MQKHIKTAILSDAAFLATLADEIWKEHYYPITGKEHVDYLLETLQSEQVIAADIASGAAVYYFMCLDSVIAGYCAVNIEEKAVRLSKLYVKKEYRQMGLSRAMVDYIKKQYAAKEYIHLIVNKRNEQSIAAYKHLGFEIVGATVIDVGNGHFMDDYVMRLEIRG